MTTEIIPFKEPRALAGLAAKPPATRIGNHSMRAPRRPTQQPSYKYS